MALSKNQHYSHQADAASYEVVDTQELFSWAAVAVHLEEAGTAGDRGRLDEWTSSAGEMPLGFNQDKVTGDTDATPPEKGQVINEPVSLKRIDVTGAADREDIGKPWYMSDDGTFTLTKQTPGMPFGFVNRHVNGTSCDLRFLGRDLLWVLQMAGGIRQLVHLSHIPDLSNLAADDDVFALDAWCHGKLVSLHATATADITSGSTTDIDFDMEVGGTAVTGATLTIDTDGAIGTTYDSAVASDGHVFNEGDALTVTTTTITTAATAGAVNLYALIEFLPGI